MKKNIINKLLIIGMVLVLGLSFIGCSNNNVDNNVNGKGTVEDRNNDSDLGSIRADEVDIVGKVVEVNDNQVVLDILSGDSVVSDKTVLSIDEATKFLDTSKEDIVVGKLLTFNVEGAVAESYPTQSKAKIIKSVKDDDGSLVDDNKEETLIGKVVSVNGKSITLDVLFGTNLISDKTVLTIDENTKLGDYTIEDIIEGKLITFYITGEILESYPTKTTAKEILSVEDDQIIKLDPREQISGLFEGEFPEKVFNNIEENNQIDKDRFFVIEVAENPTTGHLWTIVENENFKIVGNDYIATPTDSMIMGSGGHRYFGLVGLEKGEQVIKFELHSPSKEVVETKEFKITVN